MLNSQIDISGRFFLNFQEIIKTPDLPGRTKGETRALEDIRSQRHSQGGQSAYKLVPNALQGHSIEEDWSSSVVGSGWTCGRQFRHMLHI